MSHVSTFPALPTIPGGYASTVLRLPDRELQYSYPADPDAVLNDPETIAACEADADGPYWAITWPPAERMAAAVYAADWPPETRVLELGCGVGLIGLAAAARGWRVAVSDNRPEAVRVAVANALQNGLAVEGLPVDWRRPIDRQFNVLLGCEVIYDSELHAPLLNTLSRMLAPGGQVWLADFGRMHAPLFATRAEAAGFAVTLTDELGKPLPAFRTAAYQLLQLRR